MLSPGTTTGLTWRDDAIQLAVLYRLLECRETIPVYTPGSDYAFIESHLDLMHTHDLLRIDGKNWAVSKRGKSNFTTLVKMYDQAIKFNIFHAVDLTRDLLPEERQQVDDDADDDAKWRASFAVLDHFYDPRFKKTSASEDLRLAMITFVAESARQRDSSKMEGDLDPHRVVFIQKLIDGKLKSKNFWYDLRTKFLNEIDQIVETAYKWRDIANTEAQAMAVMEQLYRAGMLESRKRDPNAKECGKCKIPLAVFALMAQEDGVAFDACPACQASFVPPPRVETLYECPNCRAGIGAGQRYCTCGARVDFSLPAGSIATSVVETVEIVEEPVWGYDVYTCYDVVPYGYYSPWNPWADIAAFCVLAAVLW